MAITDWPLAERPREKLLQRGAGALSDAELLAIFLRTGVAGKSAVDLARELLVHFGSLRGLLSASRTEFCAACGLGEAKFTQLQAVLEMASRHMAEELVAASVFNNVDIVKRWIKAKLVVKSHEVFAVLFLDTQHRLIQYEELFRGSIDSASVYPREVVKRALAHNAAALILAHNHPSGHAEPSLADRQLTDRLGAALELVEVRVLDHIVVGSGEPYSFAENGLMS